MSSQPNPPPNRELFELILAATTMLANIATIYTVIKNVPGIASNRQQPTTFILLLITSSVSSILAYTVIIPKTDLSNWSVTIILGVFYTLLAWVWLVKYESDLIRSIYLFLAALVYGFSISIILYIVFVAWPLLPVLP